jgi:DNA polymerase-1
MIATGVGVDQTAWTALMEARTAEEARRRPQLEAELGVQNLQDDREVLDALQRRGLPVDKTNRIALAPYLASDPVLRDLVAWRSLIGFLQGPGSGVLQALDRSPDGRVRADLDPLGAATGRFGCSRPNLLGLPKRADPEVRGCVVPAAGFAFVVADYAAIELRVIADRVADPVLTAIFREGGDPHRLTASAFLSRPPDLVTSAERNSAKPANFGLAFGMSADTLVEYALDKFGVVLAAADAQQYRDAFFATYTGIASWHDRIKAEMPDEVRTASGRIRRFWRSRHGLCERLNSPIQGTAADGMKRSLVILHDRLSLYGARIVLAVHDEVLVEAPIEATREVAEVVRASMIEGMAEFVASVPIEVEVSIRKTWRQES